MNRSFTKFAFALLAMALMGGPLHAQYTTTFAKNVTPGQQNGLYYALPQTMLKLDFIIEETVMEKTGIDDVKKKKKSEEETEDKGQIVSEDLLNEYLKSDGLVQME